MSIADIFCVQTCHFLTQRLIPPSRPRSWYGQLYYIDHLLSTDGGIPITPRIVWTKSTDGLMEIDVIYFILWRNNDQTAPVLPPTSLSLSAASGGDPALSGSATS